MKPLNTILAPTTSSTVGLIAKRNNPGAHRHIWAPVNNHAVLSFVWTHQKGPGFSEDQNWLLAFPKLLFFRLNFGAKVFKLDIAFLRYGNLIENVASDWWILTKSLVKFGNLYKELVLWQLWGRLKIKYWRFQNRWNLKIFDFSSPYLKIQSSDNWYLSICRVTLTRCSVIAIQLSI